jgi:hypothetical protein
LSACIWLFSEWRPVAPVKNRRSFEGEWG